jgi:hypothetical protein
MRIDQVLTRRLTVSLLVGACVINSFGADLRSDCLTQFLFRAQAERFELEATTAPPQFSGTAYHGGSGRLPWRALSWLSRRRFLVSTVAAVSMTDPAVVHAQDTVTTPVTAPLFDRTTRDGAMRSLASQAKDNEELRRRLITLALREKRRAAETQMASGTRNDVPGLTLAEERGAAWGAFSETLAAQKGGLEVVHALLAAPGDPLFHADALDLLIAAAPPDTRWPSLLTRVVALAGIADTEEVAVRWARRLAQHTVTLIIDGEAIQIQGGYSYALQEHLMNVTVQAEIDRDFDHQQHMKRTLSQIAATADELFALLRSSKGKHHRLVYDLMSRVKDLDQLNSFSALQPLALYGALLDPDSQEAVLPLVLRLLPDLFEQVPDDLIAMLFTQFETAKAFGDTARASHIQRILSEILHGPERIQRLVMGAIDSGSPYALELLSQAPASLLPSDFSEEALKRLIFFYTHPSTRDAAKKIINVLSEQDGRLGPLIQDFHKTQDARVAAWLELTRIVIHFQPEEFAQQIAALSEDLRPRVAALFDQLPLHLSELIAQASDVETKKEVYKKVEAVIVGDPFDASPL